MEDQQTPERGSPGTTGHRLRHVLAEQADRLFLGLVLLVCAMVLWEVSSSEFGTISSPGPALWPTVVSVITAGTAVLALWFGRRSPEPIDRRGLGRVAGSLGALTLFILLYGFVGFLPAGALALFAILRWVCGESYLTSVLTAVLGTVGTYAVFGLVLGVPITGIGN